LQIFVNNLTLKSKLYAIKRHPSIIKDVIQGKSSTEIRSKISQYDENLVERQGEKKALNFGSYLKQDRILQRTNSRRECVYLGNYRALTRTTFAHKMYLDTRDIILTPHLLLDGYWETWITKALLRELRSGMNIVEIGSNVGYYSLIISSKIGDTGRLFAFEANPDTYQILRDNIEINGFNTRVTAEKKAVIDKVEKIAFQKLTKNLSTSSIVEYSKLNQYSEELEIIKVDATSLDQYFNNKDIKIDLIKMDAEGSEPRIFEGMKNLIINNANLTIICEFNPPLISATSVDPQKFLEKIQSYGFILKYIDIDSIPKEAPIEKLLQLGVVDLYLKKDS
jgi:FkbM family methyltransferase